MGLAIMRHARLGLVGGIVAVLLVWPAFAAASPPPAGPVYRGDALQFSLSGGDLTGDKDGSCAELGLGPPTYDWSVELPSWVGSPNPRAALNWGLSFSFSVPIQAASGQFHVGVNVIGRCGGHAFSLGGQYGPFTISERPFLTPPQDPKVRDCQQSYAVGIAYWGREIIRESAKQAPDPLKLQALREALEIDHKRRARCAQRVYLETKGAAGKAAIAFDDMADAADQTVRRTFQSANRRCFTPIPSLACHYTHAASAGMFAGMSAAFRGAATVLRGPDAPRAQSTAAVSYGIPVRLGFVRTRRLGASRLLGRESVKALNRLVTRQGFALALARALRASLERSEAGRRAGELHAAGLRRGEAREFAAALTEALSEVRQARGSAGRALARAERGLPRRLRVLRIRTPRLSEAKARRIAARDLRGLGLTRAERRAALRLVGTQRSVSARIDLPGLVRYGALRSRKFEQALTTYASAS